MNSREVADITYGQVRESIETTITHLEKAAEQVVWQVENKVWTVLGYDGWDQLREAEYSGAAVIVPRADRPQLVARLRSEGLSQKQIGDTIGVAKSTVQGDILKADSDFEQPATIVNSRGQERPTSYARFEPGPEVDDDTQAALDDFVEASPDVRLARWRKNYMARIARAGEIFLFPPADVAEKADDALAAELARLVVDLTRYQRRVQSARPRHLRAIGDEPR